MSRKMSAAEGLLDFIEQSPSVYHVVDNIKKLLLQKGFIELKETESWEIKPSKGYFVIRNDSSLIAFRMPGKQPKGFHIVASHSDSPTFKVKENAGMTVEERYIKLNTEKYGGMILSSWMDRPLSIAGRIVVKDENDTPQVKLVNVDKDLLVIPNVAIHMNRDINSKYEYNAQIDMLPLMALGKVEAAAKDKEHFVFKEIAAAAEVDMETILGHDLFLYVRERGRILGANSEFVLSPKLDDLQCVYTSTQAFADTKPKQYVNVLAVFDNEEVGSGTAQGADSTLLSDVLLRIGEVLGWSHGDYCGMVADSFLISADNAHAVHPNHSEKADPTNRPYIGGGIVLKYHGGQKYTTDAVSAARLKLLCEEAEITYQTYTNRSDIAGGSTLGNISTAHVSLSSVDIGLPQLAMHSAVETAGVQDTEDAIKLFQKLYAK
ncbi:MAG: M18 family aminopeptidase [Lachnospiraceae bacterium]|nr:M18 family aminopeptidase [Lachnospiraceae bacterium]